MKRCPSCTSEIPDIATVCQVCDKEVSLKREPPTPGPVIPALQPNEPALAQPQVRQEEVISSSPSEPIEQSKKEQSVQGPSTPSSVKHKKIGIILTILLLAGLALGVLFFVFINKPKKTQPQPQKETAAFEQTGLQLDGIMYDPAGESFVIINGEIRKTGQRVMGFQLTQIEERRITLSKNGERIGLTLP